MAHPLPEVPLLVVFGTVCGCDHDNPIAEWGEAHLDVLRRYLPDHHAPRCASCSPGAVADKASEN